MLDLSQDYFQLFGLSRDYRVDLTQLERHYRDLQQQLHPDRFARASDQERRLSMQGATLVNEAYQTLKDPIARGQYLLRLAGWDEREQSAVSPAFLMEQMELREAVAEAGQAAEPLDELDNLRRQIKRSLADYGERLEPLLSGDTPQTAEAHTLLQEMQFLRRILDEIQEREIELEESLFE